MSEDPQASCDECGRPNIVWSAPNDVWNQVTGHPAGLIICPVCFVQMANAAGFRDAWMLIPNHLVPERAFTVAAVRSAESVQEWLRERQRGAGMPNG